MVHKELQRIRALARDEVQQESISLGYLIHDVARQLKRRFEENARQNGLTLPQWRVIRTLGLEEMPLSQAALANLIDSDPMTVSRMLERLEASGLVERLPDPGDSRAKIVRLTPAAVKLFRSMREVGLGVYQDALEGLGVAERKDLVRALNTISENLCAERAETKELQE